MPCVAVPQCLVIPFFSKQFLPSFAASAIITCNNWFVLMKSLRTPRPGLLLAVCIQMEGEVVRWGLTFAGMCLDSAVRIPRLCISRSRHRLLAKLPQSLSFFPTPVSSSTASAAHLISAFAATLLHLSRLFPPMFLQVVIPAFSFLSSQRL